MVKKYVTEWMRGARQGEHLNGNQRDVADHRSAERMTSDDMDVGTR